MKAITSDIDVL